MVSFTVISSVIATVFAAVASASTPIAPSEPAPGTVWTIGQPGTIQWNSAPCNHVLNSVFDWLDFMTGDNINQITLGNVATGLDGTTATTYSWTCPNVDIHSAIYFFMFTSTTNSSDMAWTTRFAITDSTGALTTPPNATQTDGEKIPWGVGHLLSGAASASAPAASGSLSAASAPATNSVLAPTANTNSLSAAPPAASGSAAPSAASPAAASPSVSQKSSASKVLTTAGLGLGAVAAVMMA
ncbi:hypothetical protein INT43_001150, partial [Umbelopsis isabellina]